MPPRWWQYADPLPHLHDSSRAGRAKAKGKKVFGWLVVLAVVCAIVALNHRSTTITHTRLPVLSLTVPTLAAVAAPAVNVTTCSQTIPGLLQAVGTITNRAPMAHDFYIHIEFLDRFGVRLSDGTVAEPALGPNETARWQVGGIAPPDSSVASCKVVGVE
jgi:hypothetical protein